MGCSWSSSSNAVTPPQEEKQYQTSGGGVLSGKYDIKKPSAALADSTTKVANVPPSSPQQPQPTAPPQQLHHSPTRPVRIHPTTTVRSSYSPYYDKLPPRAKQCCVHHVYDGDTLTLQNKKRVRFLGMDTPELKNPVQAFSREAKAYTESRCLSSSGAPNRKNTIWISYESGGEELDKYGRLLAWVWVKTANNNNNQYECVNEGLVQEGLASVYVPSKATKLHNMTKLVAMQREARIGKRGMWHAFQDSTVLRTPYGCAYHHPKGAKKCDHLKRSSKETLQYMLESVAMDQGLHACRTCLAEDEGENGNNAVKRSV